MAKQSPLWIDEFEAEILLGYIGRLLDVDDDKDVALLQRIYWDLQEIVFPTTTDGGEI